LQSIEKELLQRLQSGTYGDIYNFPVKEYEKVLAMEEMEAEGEESEEEVRFRISSLYSQWQFLEFFKKYTACEIYIKRCILHSFLV